MNPTQLPTDGTLPLLVLQIIAVSGEFPAAFSGHFPGGCSYIESVIGKLKKDGLLRSYTKNKSHISGLLFLPRIQSSRQSLYQNPQFPHDGRAVHRTSHLPDLQHGFDLSKMGVQCRDPAQGCLTDRIMPQYTVHDRRHCVRQLTYADTCDPE